MVLNIIFSFNRAMQLDYFLTSGLNHLKFETETVIIYHTTGDHAEGYNRLIEKYRKYPHIRFEERTPNSLNPYQKIKFSKQKKKRFLQLDNFKELMEKIMRKSSCEFVMFNTDDGFWTGNAFFEEEVQNLIRLNPQSVTYRFYVGDNLDGFPAFVKKWGNCYLWDYYAEAKVTHWTFPFAVDGTIYHNENCRKLLREVWYTNPVTLEQAGVEAVMKNKVFGIGLSPEKSVLIGTKLNRVSASTLNPTIHISNELLNKKFLEGYILDLKLPEIDNSNLVPLKVYLVKDGDRECIYTFDDFGKKVQKNLGVEGAKTQME